jgi:hypothetical protein
VAGRRRDGMWDLERRRDAEGSSATIDDVLLTSLFGVTGGGNGERIGAPEPWETAIDCESGPILDRGLPCWDSGRPESLLIQELLDEKESLGVSAIVLTAKSP